MVSQRCNLQCAHFSLLCVEYNLIDEHEQYGKDADFEKALRRGRFPVPVAGKYWVINHRQSPSTDEPAARVLVRRSLCHEFAA